MNTIKLKCVSVESLVSISCKTGDIITASRDNEFSCWHFDGYYLDDDLVVRGIFGEFARFEEVKRKTDRKLVVRAMCIIARQYGWTDAGVKRVGNYKTVKEWARDWAAFYTDEKASFSTISASTWRIAAVAMPSASSCRQKSTPYSTNC